LIIIDRKLYLEKVRGEEEGEKCSLVVYASAKGNAASFDGAVYSSASNRSSIPLISLSILALQVLELVQYILTRSSLRQQAV
jgi:hypothetical protein